MKTKIVINKKFDAYKVAFDNLIRKKLNELLQYKGLTQLELANICNKLTQNAASRWLTFNEKYKTRLTAPELLALCKIIEFNILFFFEPEMSCFEADLTISNRKQLKEIKKTGVIKPF